MADEFSRRTTRSRALHAFVRGLSLAVVVATPPSVSAAPRGGGPPGMSGPPPFEDVLERHAGRLGLDAKTRQEIRTLADEARAESKELESTLHALHEELRNLLDQDSPDLDAALQQTERIGSAETSLHKLRLRTMLRIRALLTPEQRKELVRMHEERRRRHTGGWRIGPPPEESPPAPE